MERRSVEVLAVAAETVCIPHAQSILKATTERFDTGEAEPTVRYFISSLSVEEQRPVDFAVKVRCHWNIENGSHWQRDVLWREDGHLMRQHRGAHILSTLRQVALCLHSIGANRSASPPQPLSHKAQTANHRKDLAISMLKRPLQE